MNALTANKPERFGRVAVLMGGALQKAESLASGKAVCEALVRQGVDAVSLELTGNPLEITSDKKIDRVFNVVQGGGGVLQAVLQTLGIAYTGSGVMASALAMDRLRCKCCWQGCGLLTPKWFVLKDEADIERCMDVLGFPVIIKPSLTGADVGMTKLSSRQGMLKAFAAAGEFDCDIFAEDWIKGETYSVAVLAGRALPVIKTESIRRSNIDATERRLITYSTAGLDTSQQCNLQDLAITACEVIGVKGWGNVKVLIDGMGRFQVLEVDTVPVLTDESFVKAAAEQAGMGFEELVWRILETSYVQ